MRGLVEGPRSVEAVYEVGDADGEGLIGPEEQGVVHYLAAQGLELPAGSRDEGLIDSGLCDILGSDAGCTGDGASQDRTVDVVVLRRFGARYVGKACGGGDDVADGEQAKRAVVVIGSEEREQLMDDVPLFLAHDDYSVIRRKARVADHQLLLEQRLKLARQISLSLHSPPNIVEEAERVEAPC